jgi:hypothetical protein
MSHNPVGLHGLLLGQLYFSALVLKDQVAIAANVKVLLDDLVLCKTTPSPSMRASTESSSHSAVMTCGGVDVEIPVFSTSELVGGVVSFTPFPL